MVDINVLGLLYTAHAALPAPARRRVRRAAAGRRPRADQQRRRPRRRATAAASTTSPSTGSARSVSRYARRSPSGTSGSRWSSRARSPPNSPATTAPRSRRRIRARFRDMERMEADDIADAIGYIVTRPRRVAINEVLIRPTEQEQ